MKRKATELSLLRSEFSVQIFQLIIKESRSIQEKITLLLDFFKHVVRERNYEEALRFF